MSTRRSLPILLLLFIGSGCAALIYEVVWFQLLQLVIGSSALSLGVLLGTFMGGLCLGSLGLARVVDGRRHPLRVYAALEAGIGAIGLLVLFVMPAVGTVYTSWAGSGTFGIVVRAVVAGICLLPPTMLMGATLPALSRWVEMTPRGVSWLGFFYAGNTAGAVIGSLLAGFYLLRVHDMATATYVAVVLNLAVAGVAWLVARASGAATAAPPTPDSVPLEQVAGVQARLVYVAIALSGATALAAEVVWTRILSLVLGGTTYTFSLILAVFLVGLGIGSGLASLVARHVRHPRLVFGACQAALCGAIAWAALMTGSSLPYWPIDPSLSLSPWFTFQLDVVRALWVVLPGAILWGASFPLALASLATTERDAARVVGRLFAANTLGAIVGALSAGPLVAAVGSQHTQQAMLALCAVSALVVLLPAARIWAPRRPWLAAAAAVVLIPTLAGTLVWRAVPAVPALLVAYGRFAATWINQAEFLFVGEGLNASVAVSRLPSGVLNYHNAGKVQASSEPQDMRLQRMLGHLTTLLPEKPQSVFVIGFGAGVTAGAVSVDPRVEKVTIAEIEPLVPRTVSTYFAALNFGVATNPKTRIVVDDGRHVLATSKETYDAITSDPLDPWVKGAAMLYSEEFFALAKSRLKPGGVMTLFVQLYSSSEAAVKSEVATFFKVFPNGLVFGNTTNGAGYDLVLVGQAEPVRIDLDRFEGLLQDPMMTPVAQSLREAGYESGMDLLSTYAGHARDLGPWMADAAITRDLNLRLQYLAGLGLNQRQGDTIYRNLLVYRRSPDGVFVGSDGLKAWLWDAIQNPRFR